MDELRQSRISMTIHAVIAIAIGYVSVMVATISRTLFAVVIGLVVLYVTGFMAQKATGKETGKKGLKWWAANGLVIYLFIWYISWTVFFNLAV